MAVVALMLAQGKVWLICHFKTRSQEYKEEVKVQRILAISARAVQLYFLTNSARSSLRTSKRKLLRRTKRMKLRLKTRKWKT